ncbi:MAG TPA: serine protease [Thermoanaerobaculia bacterium]
MIVLDNIEHRRSFVERFREVAPQLGIDANASTDAQLFRLFELFARGWTIEETLEKLAAISNQICSIVEVEGEYSAPRGTGFLVAPNLVLSAAHVIVDPDERLGYYRCSFNNIRFRDNDVLSATPVSVLIDAQVLLSTASPISSLSTGALDVTLLRLQEAVGETRGFISVGDEVPAQGEPVYVISHPGGNAVSFSAGKVSRAHNQLTDVAVYHDVDTADGASGAPIFNREFDLIGLHRGAAVDGNGDRDAAVVTAILNLIEQHLPPN